MQIAHIHETFEDPELVQVDRAWSDEAEPVTVRSPRRRGSGLVFGALVAGAALTGVLIRPGLFYRALRKPSFQPPRWLFAPMWTGLYALMAASADRIYRAPPSAERTKALALWGGQLALNAAWTPLFFGAKRPRLALADSTALLATIGAYIAVARNVDKKAAAMFAPYAAWVAFATLLNAAIVKKNPWLTG